MRIEERKRTAVPASTTQREPAFEKNWRGMMAPSPSTPSGAARSEGSCGGGGGGGGGCSSGDAWHPPRSSFLSHMHTELRSVRNVTLLVCRVLGKASWGASRTRAENNPRRSRGRGGAFAQSFQRIRRRDADALPRLRHLSRHARPEFSLFLA